MTLPQNDLFTDMEWNELMVVLSLSNRQAQIAREIMRGRSDRQIAELFGITHATVRTHLKQVFARLRVCDRNEMILTMVRQSMAMARSQYSTK